MATRTRSVTRRQALELVGLTALAGATGQTASAQTGDDQEASVDRGYVASYHWGFVLLDGAGNERDRLSLSPGDELRLTLFNVEAERAVERLPQAVRDGLPDADERMRRNEQSIPAPQGLDLDAAHEAAEAAYPDHGLVLLDDDLLVRPPGQGSGGMGPGGFGGHHGPGGMWGGESSLWLAPPTYLWHAATVPAELGFVASTGSYGFACHVYCGYGHPYMADRGRIVVEDG